MELKGTQIFKDNRYWPLEGKTVLKPSQDDVDLIEASTASAKPNLYLASLLFSCFTTYEDWRTLVALMLPLWLAHSLR